MDEKKQAGYDTRAAYKNEWQRANRDRVVLLLAKDDAEGTKVTKARIKAAAEDSPTACGSVSAWLTEAAEEKLQREGK